MVAVLEVKNTLKVLLLSLMLAGLVLTGCGGGEESSDGSGKVKSEGPVTLVFGRGADSVGLDPAMEDDGESLNVCGNIYDTLVHFKDGGTEIEPMLAESWDISEDGLVYTFKLRAGVTFHDGTPFNADSVLFSFNRQRLPDHPHYPDAEGGWVYWDSMGMTEVIKDIRRVDDLTVEFKLNRPEAPFLANLGMNFVSIVSPTAAEKYGSELALHPVGTGPFELERWDRDQRIVLRANLSYWDGTPAIDRLIIVTIPTPEARYLQYKSGKLDGFNFPGTFEIEQIKNEPATNLLTQEGMNICYVAMNNDRPPFNDKRVRQAINMAINKQKVIDDTYMGQAVVAKNPIPPVLWGYNDEVEDFTYDPVKAKELLAEAGYPDGFETTLWVMPNPRPYLRSPDKVGSAIIADLEDVGIRARKVSYDWGTYLDKTKKGEHDMAILGWSGDNGDPDNFLNMLLSSRAAEPPANNIAFWKNPEFDQLMESARSSVDHEERVALYKEAQALVHEEAPWVCLAHGVQMMVMGDHVEGFSLHPTSRTDFRKVSIKR